MNTEIEKEEKLDLEGVTNRTLKAKDLVKRDIDLKFIYENIKNQNEYGSFKVFIPNDKYFSEKAKLELMENGFKVYKGDWDGIMKDVYIIEW